jgi:uncharacterized protein YndB with AHSA1/START domain
MELTLPSDREIVMTRVFVAPRAIVFDAFTNPKLLQRWLLGPDGWSMPICEIEPRAGGPYRFVWRNDENGREFSVIGTHREFVPPERIVRTEKFDDPDMPGETVVTTVFAEHGSGTAVKMTVLHPSRESRDQMLETGMERGVVASFDRLAGILDRTAV